MKWARAVAGAATASVALLALGCPAAPADPDFPDLGRFMAVDTGPFETASTDGKWVKIDFSTPDGMTCHFDGAASMKDETTSQELNCSGQLPDVTYRTTPQMNCQRTDVRARGGLVYYIDEPEAYYEPEGVDCLRQVRVLSPGQKLSSGNITCVVGEGALTACLDARAGQRHGFVLQPSGSRAF